MNSWLPVVLLNHLALMVNMYNRLRVTLEAYTYTHSRSVTNSYVLVFMLMLIGENLIPSNPTHLSLRMILLVSS